MSIQLRNFLRFWLIIAVQVLLNKLTLRWWSEPGGFPVFVPLIYPLFILLLPFETPVWLALIIGAVTGLTVDTLTNTGGMHAAATILIAYLRPNVLTALLPRALEDYPGQSPSVKNLGWPAFLTYAGFLILLHHAVFFSIEIWSFSNMLLLLLKIAASAVTSMLFVVVYLLLFTRQTASSGLRG
jgi:rod shape-determining protein MreD